MRRKQPRSFRRRDVTSEAKIQYTIRSVPKAVDDALRQRARENGKSLNETALEALRRGLDVEAQPVRHHDFDDLIGTWVEDPAYAEAREFHERIDEEMWR
jgi:plasmid stability protein